MVTHALMDPGQHGLVCNEVELLYPPVPPVVARALPLGMSVFSLEVEDLPKEF